MAISFIGSTGGSAINGGNVTLTLPGTYKAGDVAIVNITLGTSKATTMSVASSSGGAYDQIVSTITSSLVRFAVFAETIPSTGALTQAVITGTGGSTDATAAVVHIFRGCELSSVASGQIDGQDVAATSTTGATANPDSPSITVASCSCVVITSVGFGIINALTAATSWLNATTAVGNDTNPANAAQAWITNVSTSALNPVQWTSTGVADTWCSATIALKPSIDYGSVFGTQMDMGADAERAKTFAIESY